MTFEELDQKFPNGFDDAEISSVTINYQNRTANVQLNLRRNSPDGPDRDVYERAELKVVRFYYFSVEPPDTDHLTFREKRIQVDGFPEDPSKFPLFESLRPTLPAGAFCCRLYVHDWNSFIHIAAEGAQCSWIE
ncbi:MAG TPA: hypothetical protein VIH88_09715 [Candidatus Acidoferrales bacterium]